MPTFVERVLQINGQHESRRIIRRCCFAFLTAGAYVICRSVADALFSAPVGARHLPTMHPIATSFVLVLTVISMYRFRRWQSTRNLRPRETRPSRVPVARQGHR